MRPLLVLLAMLATLQASHAQHNLYVVLVDLSQTEKTVNHTGNSEFKENVLGVSKLLALIPASSRVLIVGITNHSYMNPVILLAARLGDDPGIFASHLAAGRRNLIVEWNQRSKSLTPSFTESDLLGAIRFSGEIFARSGAKRKTLFVFSDGRNFTNDLDLETPATLDVEKSLGKVRDHGLFAALNEVEVRFLGVGDHSGKRPIDYTIQLSKFWLEFVRRSGGVLRVFSTTRDVQDLIDATSSDGMKSRRL